MTKQLTEEQRATRNLRRREKRKGKSVQQPKVTAHANGNKFTEKRPGVVAVILDSLMGASEQFPITKSKILERLVQAFPDRETDKMKATLVMQVPSGLRTEKGIIVVGRMMESEKGYWIDEQATAVMKAGRKSAGK